MPTRSPPAAPGPTDTVPAMLTPGEYVLKRDAVRRIGVGKLNRLNQGYDNGGEVQPAPRATWAGGTPVARATLVAPPPPAPSQTPAVTTGPATLPIGNTVDGALVTHYGYPGDKYWDPDSGKGYGDRDNILTPLRSVALTVDQRARLFPNAGTKNFPKTSTGQSFQLGGNTFVDDDTAPEPGYRVDIYHPGYAGLDQGVSAQTAAQRAAIMPPGYAPAIYNQPQPVGPVIAQMGGYSGQAPQHFDKGGAVTKEEPPPKPVFDTVTQETLPPAQLPPPGMAPGLGTIGGAPVQPPAGPVSSPSQVEPSAPIGVGVSQPADTTPAPTVGGTALTGEARAKILKEAKPSDDPVVQVEQPKAGTTDQSVKPSDDPVVQVQPPKAGTTDQTVPSDDPVVQVEQPKPAEKQPSTQEPAKPAESMTPEESTLAENFRNGTDNSAAAKAANDKDIRIAAGQAPPPEKAPADQQPKTEAETEPGTTKGTTISGTHTVFGLNYDGKTWDPQDNGRGFFTDNQGRNYNTRDPRVKVVAIPGDVLNATFGNFLQRHPDGSYTLINTPEARKIYQEVESAHVEAKDAQGNIHKFPIGDVQGALAGHPGKVIDFSYGAAKEMGYADNGHIDYQIVKGDGTPYPVSDLSKLPAYAGTGKGDGGGKKGGAPKTTTGEDTLVPMVGGTPTPVTPTQGGPLPSSQGGGYIGGGSEAPTSSGGGSGSLGGFGGLGDVLAGAAVGSMLSRPQPAPAEEEPTSATVKALINRGFTPAEAQARAQSLQTIIPHEPLEGGQPPPAPGIKPALPAPSLALPAPGGPPAAPGEGVAGAQTGLGDAIKVLQSLGFKQKGQAAAMLKGITGKDAGELARNALQAYQQGKGGAIQKPRPGQPPAAPGAPPLAPARPSAPQAAQPATAGPPPTPQERRAQITSHAEQAIAEKRPMHISYISAPKEAERYPTRESRTIQYEEHSPEARLMGSTTGQLVGHSLIPVESKVDKKGDPYILGLSTNVMANNHRHINEKLATMGRQSPYPEFNQKFFHDVEGYLGNLNAGHTGTGQGYQVGTEEHPISPDLSHTPHKLTRHEADFINLAINNTKALAQHKRDPEKAAQAQALRELARSHGTLITEAGETNRMRHEIEQQQPGWATGIVNGRHVRGTQVLEPSVRSFTTGLIHEVHPTEESLPQTIRPGPEYQQMTAALHRAIQGGRPDTAIATSLHSNLQHNANINAIERAFSEGKINEGHAREALRGLGEDPDEYRYIQGSGGLITPYEENPEAITPEEHNTLKDNLRKQWIGGKLDVENYRRKAAEVPLPEIAARKPSQPSPEEAKTPAPVSSPAKPKPPAPSIHEPMPGEEEPEEPKPEEPSPPPMPTRPKPPRKAPGGPPEAPEAPAKVKTPEPEETEPKTPVKEKQPPKAPLPKPEEEEPTPAPTIKPAKPGETPGEQPAQPKAEEPPPAPSGPAKVAPRPRVRTPLEEAKPEERDFKDLSHPEKQAYVKQRIKDRGNIEGAVKLRPVKNDNGTFAHDEAGNPQYEKDTYNLVNSPILGKKRLDSAKDQKFKDQEDIYGKDEHTHLNQIDRKRLSYLEQQSAVDTMADKIVNAYQTHMQHVPEVMAAKGWYTKMQDKLKKAFGPDAEIFAQLLGATSARTGVKQNFIQALDAYDQLKNGNFDNHIQKYLEAHDHLARGEGALARHMHDSGIVQEMLKNGTMPIDKKTGKPKELNTDAAAMAAWIAHHNILPKQKNGSKYNANSNQVLKVLAQKWLQSVKAPKTPNFAGNLSGRTREATIDVWAARFLHELGNEGNKKPWMLQPGGEGGVKGLDFSFSQRAMRKAADKLGLHPDDLQAIAWYHQKHLWDQRGHTKGQGAKKASFDETFDRIFSPSGQRLTDEEARKAFAGEQDEPEVEEEEAA